MFESPRPSFARTLVHRAEVESTNDLARLLLAEGVAELPIVVVADRQTAGRGRASRSWWSDSGSLTFSIGLDPAAFGLREAQGPRVALAVAVATIDALEPAFLAAGTVGIRWPNDLESGEKKLAGILPEWVDTPDGRRIVIGIGLNVTTDLDAAPEDVRRLATSVARLGGHRAAGRESVLRAILERIGPTLEALGREDPALADRWAGLDTLRDRVVRVDLGRRIVVGRGAGITATGGLRLEVGPTGTAGGEDVVLHGGQVLRDRA